jgi:hypothetical protein
MEVFKAFGWAAKSTRDVGAKLLQKPGNPSPSIKLVEAQVRLLDRILCNGDYLEAVGVQRPQILKLHDKGLLQFLNEHFKAFQMSAVTAIMQYLGRPNDVSSNAKVDLVAQCRSRLCSNQVVAYNFVAGVVATWKGEEDECPESSVIESTRVLLLRKAVHRSSGSWI